jgi:oxaloacetate decarboxylase alpha subunit
MNLREVRTLLRLLREHDLEELEIEEAGQRIRLRRRVMAAPSAPAHPTPGTPAAAVTIAEPAVPPAPLPSGPPRLTITAPMVGTFYRAPAPNAEPFVREGVLVEVGVVVCIIEAMKLMNEIEAEVRGRVMAVLVENGQPVEYGQPLFYLEPA